MSSFIRRVRYAAGLGDRLYAVPGLDSTVAVGAALDALHARGEWTPPTDKYPADHEVLGAVALLRERAPEIFLQPPPPVTRARLNGPGALGGVPGVVWNRGA